jgi:hypothetical protein
MRKSKMVFRTPSILQTDPEFQTRVILGSLVGFLTGNPEI